MDEWAQKRKILRASGRRRRFGGEGELAKTGAPEIRKTETKAKKTKRKAKKTERKLLKWRRQGGWLHFEKGRQAKSIRDLVQDLQAKRRIGKCCRRRCRVRVREENRALHDRAKRFQGERMATVRSEE